MKAMQLAAPRRMEMVDIEPPAATDTEVLVDLLRITVCGSDLHVYRGRQPCDEFPVKPGKPAHECLARVVRPGPLEWVEEGDMVLIRPPDGDGLREGMALPPNAVIPLVTQEIDPDRAVMAQMLAPAVHCCRRLENPLGSSVLIIGQGPAGLTLANIVRRMGASPLVTCEPIPERRRESARIANACVDPREDPERAALEANDGKPYDLVIEAVGDAETIELAPRLAAHDGTVMFYGLPGLDAAVNLRGIFSKQLLLTTTEGPARRDFELAQRMILDGDVDVDRMITHRMSFDEAPRGFALAESRERGVLRVVLDLSN
jgi:2-desacetyl-2-hydroxyethyl bacteriochlorophyllide A dehydrogenase